MSGNPRAPGRGPSRLLDEMVRFLGTTVVGLGVDLGLYFVLVAAGTAPGVANGISSATAVVLLYVLSTRLTFKVQSSMRSFATFVGWYVLSITAFSFLVQYLHDVWDMAPLFAKVLTLPVSFLANFLAVRTVLSSTPAAGRERGARGRRA